MERQTPQTETAGQYYSLPSLPFAMNALEPNMSAETFEYHYGKHHKGYVDKLNVLIKGTEFESLPLEEVIKRSSGPLFNNAAQAWNHTFFWKCLTPNSKKPQSGALLEAIEKSFGSLDDFKTEFSKQAVDLFGSGWVWLVKDQRDQLMIKSLGNAGNPLVDGMLPLLVCDVWEHAYYIDYRNVRKDYVQKFWNVVNWNFVQECFGEKLH
ncbi:MAG TPA: superoxide dismutase [Bdellovibrionales bacterium]|nr:superoxide dismutase [Bdellovibrionales bacterium]